MLFSSSMELFLIFIQSDGYSFPRQKQEDWSHFPSAPNGKPILHPHLKSFNSALLVIYLDKYLLDFVGLLLHQDTLPLFQRSSKSAKAASSATKDVAERSYKGGGEQPLESEGWAPWRGFEFATAEVEPCLILDDFGAVLGV